MKPSTEHWLLSTISKRLERIAEGKETMAEDRALTLLSILKDVAGDIPSLTSLPQHVKEWLEAAINARLDAIADKREIAAEERIATLTEALAALRPPASPGGAVERVDTGAGLSGGPITTTGTISLSTSSQQAIAKANTAVQPEDLADKVGTTGDYTIGGDIVFTGNGPTFRGAATNVTGTNPALQLRTETSVRRVRVQYRATDAVNGPLNIDRWTGSGWSTVISLTPDLHLIPGSDGSQDIGTGSRRWRQVYAVDGAINTSDARDKTEPRNLTSNELAAAADIARLPCIFQWIQAIQDKGEEARLHTGPTVQAVISVMQAHDLDPFRYGFVCYDEWDERLEVRDEETGEVTQEYRPAGNRYSLRPTELAWWVIRGIAHDQDEIKNRLQALEAGDV